jgi:DNA-binding CsgD family transcriptional regulator
MLYDPATVLRTELYADWACRYRMLQPMALAVELPASRYPAVLSFHREKAAAPNAYEREMGILHLLLPAFKAGVFACRRLVRNRASLTILIDRLPGGIAVFDVAGHLLHQNPAIGRLLASEPESARVHAELGRIAGLVAALAHRAQSKARASTPTEPAELEVRTARARYHIRGSHVGCELLPHPAAVIVCIENASPERLTSMEVASRHRLTAREIEVALLLAEGRSNAQVARMLGFTIHTARRHAEHILLKLELHSRAEVGPKLYGLSGSS